MAPRSSSVDDLVWADATAQAAAIARGDVSSTELVEAYLARIDRHDGTLGSYVHVAVASARAAAVAADAATSAARGSAGLPPFHGVTLSVKDSVDVAGMPTTHACKLLLDNVAEVDQPVIGRFRGAGFVVLGKSNLPEFCTSMTDSEVHGACRNPWDHELTAGGSSGGAAASLAAGLCAVSHGTDGAGSIRVPAAFCGLVGVKVTRGLLTADPRDEALLPGTSESGVLCRSVRDAAGLLDVLTDGAWSPGAGMIYRDELDGPRERLRIGITTSPPMGATDDAIVDLLGTVGTVLESLGHQVEEATPDWMTVLAAFGPASVPGGADMVDPERIDQLEPRNRPLVRNLQRRTALEHVRWYDGVRSATRQFGALWDDIDVLVSPTCGITPPKVAFAPWHQTPEEHMATFASFPNFAQPFNLSGQPAFSLPLGWSEDGVPIGVQIAGRHLSEAVLLRLAASLEEALPWSGVFPEGYRA